MKRWLVVLTLLLTLPATVWAQSSAITSGGTLPATCVSQTGYKNMFYKTGASSGLYVCTATNTWTNISPSTIVTSSTTLTANAIVLGNGGSDLKVLGSLGTTTTLLHGNAGGAPTFGAVGLTADVTGTLPVANGGTNLTSATDDDVMVGNGTTWQSKSLPNCSAASQALEYDTASNTFTCVTIAGGASTNEVVAASDQDVSSNTTIANDNELFFTMVAGAIYSWELQLAFSSPAGGGTPDMKLAFSGPATLTGEYTLENFLSTADVQPGAPASGALNAVSTLGTATTPRMTIFRGWASSTGGGSGSSGFILQWAQNTSSMNATRRLVGSVLRYRRIN